MALSNLFGWNNKTESAPAAACGSACGSGDKPEEKPAACGSACGAGDKQPGFFMAQDFYPVNFPGNFLSWHMDRFLPADFSRKYYPYGFTIYKGGIIYERK